MLENGTRNYYEILGITRDASQEEIRMAYLRLAKIYQSASDLNSNDKRMAELNHIYEVLSNPRTRLEYDARFIRIGGYDFTVPGNRDITVGKGQPQKQAAVGPKPRLTINKKGPRSKRITILEIVVLCILFYVLLYFTVATIGSITTLPNWVPSLFNM